MAKAEWNGVVLAESDSCEIVEGNLYFPPESLNRQYFKNSETSSFCFWKGRAKYYTINVEGELNVDAAWTYPKPFWLAKNIRDHVAFWKDITVTG